MKLIGAREHGKWRRISMRLCWLVYYHAPASQAQQKAQN
jgi:hypothetical protein